MRLFKFRSLEEDGRKYAESLLFDKKIYFSNHSELNDPFEFGEIICFDEDLEVKISKYKNDYPEVFEKYLANKNNEVIEQYIHDFEDMIFQNTNNNYFNLKDKFLRIFSMSEDWQDLTMWSHYADGHKGICIEFSDEFIQKYSGQICDVIYHDELPEYNFYNPQDAGSKIARTKSNDWKYEKEWRLIDQEQVHEEILTIDPFKAIYLGCKFDFNDPILSKLKEVYSNLKIIPLEISTDQFKLIPRIKEN